MTARFRRRLEQAMREAANEGLHQRAAVIQGVLDRVRQEPLGNDVELISERLDKALGDAGVPLAPRDVEDYATRLAQGKRVEVEVKEV